MGRSGTDSCVDVHKTLWLEQCGRTGQGRARFKSRQHLWAEQRRLLGNRVSSCLSVLTQLSSQA